MIETSVENSNMVKIIAEIGSNHNGNLETAFEMIKVASGCGANIAKFQGFLADDLLAAGDPNYEVMKQLEIPELWYPELIKCCKENGILFLSTATNFKTLNWMEKYGAWGYKVASCNITHRPLIDRLIEIGKPIIISTGLATINEIFDLYTYFKNRKFTQFSFLHCISKYPALPHDLRLRNIKLLKELMRCTIGYSDHSEGIYMPIVAVSLGAEIIEKHISLDKTGLGLDHEVAILPEQFKEMTRAIRQAEIALVTDIEPDRENIFTMRRSVHFAVPMKAGQTIAENHLKIVRPEDGLMPERIYEVIGKKVNRDVKKNEPLTYEDIKTDG